MTEQRMTADLEELKASWRADPSWDIEDSEGFDAHRDELAAFRAECELEWSNRNTERLTARAAELGCPGNLSLAAFVENLESDFAELKRRVDAFTDKAA